MNYAHALGVFRGHLPLNWLKFKLILNYYEFLSAVKSIFIEKFNINDTKISRKGENNTFDYRINKQSDVELISKFLYKDSDGLFLIRKYNKLKFNYEI